MHWLFLFIAIVAEIIGTTALKMSNGFTRFMPATITGISYMVAFYFLALTLKTLSVGIAYAIWSGIGVAAIALIGFWFFKQPLDTAGVIGIGLIIAGVIVLNVFSNTSA